MRIAAIVQARMLSRRLPGKVLADIHGKPLLQYVIERLERSAAISEVVVATSTDASDDPVERFCRDSAIRCIRGPLDNVAARFFDVVSALMPDAFVRISGDSPLIDQRVVDAGARCFLEAGADLASNVVTRSYPSGESVEVVSSDAFRRAFRRMSEPHHLEHVTPFFYERRGEFRIASFAAPHDWQDVRLVVDTPQDLEIVAAVIGAMERPHWGYGVAELVRLRSAVVARWNRCASA